MSVFLLILKIIGIVLLVILGLIVVIALLALFCPFVYRVKGSYHEKNLQLQVRIWWLGRLLGLCADTAEEGFHTYVRIFGFRKELHLQKEKEDSADFKKPVQEDSPQEGIKDRSGTVSYGNGKYIPNICAAIDRSGGDNSLSSGQKKENIFSGQDCRFYPEVPGKDPEYFAKDSLFFEKYTDILEKRNANVPEMVSFFQ